MSNSQKLIQAFKNKFDSMSPEDREKYLENMGLKYKKVTELVPADPKLSMTIGVSRIVRKRNVVSGMDGVRIINSGENIPVCVYPGVKKLHGGSLKGKAAVKKIKSMEESGE